MPDLTVWPTDGADGAVSSEARWRKMGRLWVPSGVDMSPLGIGGGSGALAPTLAAGPTINVAIGGCWLDGHYAELTTPASVPATATGLLVVRFTPADNHAELLYRDAATVPTQTLATWELPIAKMTAGTMSDLRRSVALGGSFQPPACILQNTTYVPVQGTTTVPYPTEVLDTDGMHDTVTNNDRITFRTPGIYLLTSYAQWNPAVTTGNYRYHAIRANGSITLAADRKSSAAGISGGEGVAALTWLFAANEYVQHVVVQDSGGNLALQMAKLTAAFLGPYAT